MSDLEMRQILGELEMLSHGSVSAWNASGGRDKPDSRILQWVGDEAPHVYWRRRYEACETDQHRARALAAATHDLNGWRSRAASLTPARDLPSDAQILDAQILEYAGQSIRDVALRLRCTETRVRKTRLAANLAPADGSTVVLVADSKHDRVRELADRGLTERQIGLMTSVSKTHIRRILGRTA